MKMGRSGACPKKLFMIASAPVEKKISKSDGVNCIVGVMWNSNKLKRSAENEWSYIVTL